MAEFPSWQQGLRQAYPSLRGAAKSDVVVVGGGLAGVMTALMLQHSGVNTLLLEADMLGHGASFGCSGVVSCQAIHSYRRTAQVWGMDAARTYAHLLREAVIGVSDLTRQLDISCGLTPRSLYVYAETTDDLPALEQLLHLESRLGLSVSPADDAGGCPFPVELSAVMHHQYTLHPLPFLLGMAREAVRLGCRIHEHTPVLQQQGTHLRTPDGAAQGDIVIFCTGVPLDCRSDAVLQHLEPRLQETRILRGAPPLHTVQRSVQADEPGFVPLQNGLLMSLDRGAYGTRQEEDSRIIRDRTLRALLPECRTVDVILRREVFTRDGLPLIGAVKPSDSRLLMIGGFNGHGLTGAFLAAKTLVGQILGHPSAESRLFLPFRSRTPKSALVVQPFRSAARRRLRRWSRMTAPRCPHMGCPLRYNPSCRQWECPCHGSSFDVFGQVLSAPAARNAALSPRDRPSS